MDRLGHELLPGSTFTLDQDCAAPGSDLSDKIKNLLHRGAFADDILEVIALLQRYLEPYVLFEQSVMLGRILHGQDDLVVLEGLGYEIKGPEFGCPDGLFDRRKSGEHKSHRVVFHLLELF